MQGTMFTRSPDKDTAFKPAVLTEVTVGQMVSSMRMLLALSALLAVLLDPSSFSGLDRWIWLIFMGYAVHSVLAYIYSRSQLASSRTRLIHWLDVLWYGFVVLLTGTVNSFFFLFLFFPILTSSFRWGFEEGAKITIFSAGMYAVIALPYTAESDLPRLLLRTTFLLAFGYMCVFWGASQVELKRRLEFLYEVSRISNPRFGVDQTITTVLEKIREYFDGRSCVLVRLDKESGVCSVRSTSEGAPNSYLKPISVDQEASSALLGFPPHQIVVYRRPMSVNYPFKKSLSAYSDSPTSHWVRYDCPAYMQLAELLNAKSFISVPVALRNGTGRIHVATDRTRLTRADAQFLCHISAQIFPVIENIELLDRMASEAASREREKMALDLHDTAIQPYIGLQLGLSAIHRKAHAENPLRCDIEKLVVMSAAVVNDLRRYARTVTSGSGENEPMFLALARQQAGQVGEFYGIDIQISAGGDLNVSDRLTAEALQLIREGLSNICKHSKAQRGAIRLWCADRRLHIEIENENDGTENIFNEFTPRSISERVAFLDGTVRVVPGLKRSTLVQIEIPV